MMSGVVSKGAMSACGCMVKGEMGDIGGIGGMGDMVLAVQAPVFMRAMARAQTQKRRLARKYFARCARVSGKRRGGACKQAA